MPQRATSRRLSVALLVGLPLSFACMLLVYGVRRDLMQVMSLPMRPAIEVVSSAVRQVVDPQALAATASAANSSWRQ